MMELFSIMGKIELDGANKASKDLDKLDGKGKSTAGKLGGFAKTAAKGAAIAGAAAVAMGVAAFAATKKVTDGFDNIAKTSAKMGISTDAYQEMDYWASQNGISSQDMEKAVGRLNQRVGMAADGNEKYSDALSALGVDMDSVKDGTLSTEDAMYQSISALSEMESETDKAAMASELFGTKLGRELMPALQDGSLSLEDAKKKAEELGIVVGNDTLQAAEKFNDTWDDLTRSIQVFGQKVIAKLMPAFQTMMDWVISHMPQIQSIFTTVFDAIGNVLSKVRGYVKGALDWFVRMKDGIKDSLGQSKGIFDNFKPVVETLKNTFMNFVEGLAPIWENLKQLFESLTPIIEILAVIVGAVLVTALGILVGIVNGVVSALEPFINAIVNLTDFIVNMVNVVVALLTGDFAGAWDYWKEAGQSAIDFFMNAFETIYQFLAGFVEGVIDFFYGLYMTLVGNSIIPDMVNAIVDWFKNMWTWVVELVEGLVESVVELFTKLKDKAEEIMNIFLDVLMAVWSYIENTFENALKFILALVTGDFQGMREAMQDQMDNAKALLFKIWEGIKKLIGSKASEILSNIIDKFIEIKKNIQDKIEEAKAAVTKKFAGMVTIVKEKASEVVSTVRDKFNEAKDKIINPILDAKDKVSEIVDSIKSFFTDMKLKIPKPSMPKMPSFSLKSSSKTVLGKKISYPSGIGVNWNAKGGIFKKPTILNTAKSGLQGVGEVPGESEAILPLNSKTLGSIGSMISSTMSNSNRGRTVVDNSNLEALITDLIVAVKEGKVINMNAREVGKVVGPYVKEFNEFNSNRRGKFS